MIEKISTLTMSGEDWLHERRNSIGGSDAGAILGLNKYRSPYTIWAEKTGRLPEPEDNEAMRQGRDLEAYVADRFSEKSGKRVERCNYILRNTNAPHLHANIDRRIIGEKSGLECKTASAFSTKAYKGGNFPESYYAQCVSYLAVTGWERWYLAALVLNKAFFIYQITTIENDAVPDWCESSVYVDADEINSLKKFVSDFWESYVIPDVQPPVDGSKSTEDALQSVYQNDNGTGVELFGRDNVAKEYLSISSEIKSLQEKLNVLKQTIQVDMGECSLAFCGQYLASWKTQARRTFNTAEFHKKNPKIELDPFFKTTKTRVFKITKLEEL